MKKALSLILLAVVITSLTMSDVHEGQDNYDYKKHGKSSGYDFVLKFERAARDGLWDQKSNRFKVVFNGKLVKDFLPKDYKIHKETLKLKGRNGKNTINFIGTGVSDSYGSQVDNIKLLKNGKDYIKNGGFEKGHKLGTGWLIFKNGEFQGWNCKDEMQVGSGRIYNSNWPEHTHVCELDANRNSDIFQKFDTRYHGKYDEQEDCSSESESYEHGKYKSYEHGKQKKHH